MIEKKFSVYLGKNSSSHGTGFDIEGPFLCVFEGTLTTGKDDLRNTVDDLRHTIQSVHFSSAGEFSTHLHQFIQKNSITSLSAVLLREDGLYAFTHNAQIHLLRDRDWFLLAQKSQQAAGKYNEKDFFVLTTQTFTTLHNPFEEPPSNNDPKEFTDLVENVLHDQKEVPAACLAVRIETSSVAPIAQLPVLENAETTLPINTPVEKIETHQKVQLPTLPIGAIRVILAILVVGVVGWKILGTIQKNIQQQKETSFHTKITAAQSTVSKLHETLFTTSNNAQALDTVQAEVAQLLKDFPDKKSTIEPIAREITQMKSLLGDTRIVNDAVFYDLQLIDKKAGADAMAVSADTLCILDKGRSKVYLISTQSKAQDSFTLPDAKNSQLIGCNSKTIYVFSKEKGVYQIDSTGTKNIIAFDKEWGEIRGLQLFNTNVYLLDAVKDEIFKYIPVTDGYSDAQSYFKAGNSIKLNDAKSFVIDYDVYILTANKIYKYTGGVKNTFSLATPTIIPRLSALYKNADTESLYGLSSAESRIVAIDKNGAITKSIFNPKLKDVTYFGTQADKKILFLYKGTIYSLDNF